MILFILKIYRAPFLVPSTTLVFLIIFEVSKLPNAASEFQKKFSAKNKIFATVQIPK
jgi:hypothetical protein